MPTEEAKSVNFNTLTNDCTNLKEDLKKSVTDSEYTTGQIYINSDDFEIGNIIMSASGWTYSDKTTRVRTKEGVSFNLKQGDVIRFSTWGTIRIFIGWNNGTEYKTSDWQSSDYIVKEDGSYVLCMMYTPESTVADAWDIVQYLVIDRINSLNTFTDSLDKLVKLDRSYVPLTNNEIVTSERVYGNSGVFGTAPGYNRTDYIAIDPMFSEDLGIYCTFVATTGVAFYDRDKHYISGYSSRNLPEYDGTNYKYLKIPKGSCYFVACMSKTYYTNSNSFQIAYINNNFIAETNQIDFNDVGIRLATLDTNGNIQLTASARSVTDLILVHSGDVVANADIKLSVFEYDKSDLSPITSSSGSWLNTYTVKNDSYIRILFQSADITDIYTSTSITNNGKIVKHNLTDYIHTTSVVKNILVDQKATPQIMYGGVGGTGNYAFMSIAHRGFNMGAPESTASAFKLARKMGFRWVETDIQFTSDDVPVLLHDWTVDRTSNGTGKITDMTYAEAHALDFGSWKSSKYIGEKIMTLDEFLLLCRNIGLSVALEYKANVAWTQSQLDIIFDAVKKYHMESNVIFIPASYISETLTAFPTAKVCIGASSTITQTTVTDALSHKTDDNEVYILTPITANTDESVQIAIDADVPVIFWNIQSEAQVASANPYISGYITDGVLPEDVLYKLNI